VERATKIFCMGVLPYHKGSRQTFRKITPADAEAL